MFNFKKSKKSEKKNMGKPEYHIIVKKYMAKNIPQVIAEFNAIQDKTGDMNLVMRNVDYDFKEEVTIKESNLITDIRYRLDLMKHKKEKQIELLKNKIVSIEKRIKNIDKGYIVLKDDEGKPILDDNKKEQKEKVNELDEKESLRKYKVLKYCIENEGDGSHIEINLQGLKQISYLYDDGILKPIFHVCKDDSISLHVNEGANRKRFYSEQYLIDKEFQEDTNGLLGNKLDKLLKFAVIIILALEVFAAIQLMGGYKDYHSQVDSAFMNEMRSQAQGSAIECAFYYSQVLKSNGEALIKYNNDLLNKSTNQEEIDKGSNPITDLSNKLLAMS